jgi:hypothetical protein
MLAAGSAGLGELTMLKNFDDVQKYGKDNMDATMKAWGHVSKSVQAIAAEAADYSKKSFEEGSAAMEKLLGAKSLDKAMEIQSAKSPTKASLLRRPRSASSMPPRQGNLQAVKFRRQVCRREIGSVVAEATSAVTK